MAAPVPQHMASRRSRLPDPVAALTQFDAQLHFQAASFVIGQRVVQRIELRQQAQPEFLHIPPTALQLFASDLTGITS